MGRMGNATWPRCDFPADLLHRLVERVLAPTRDEHIIHAFLNEALRRGEANTGRASRDHRDFSCEFVGHDWFLLSLPPNPLPYQGRVIQQIEASVFAIPCREVPR